MHVIFYKGWRILTFLPVEESKSLFGSIRSSSFDEIRWLKQHHRSDVLIFSDNGKKLVLKTPKEKNEDLWIRFTTLYRKGEAVKNLESMEKLNDLDIPTTKPVMAAERRRFGMVVDSWVVYEYLEGKMCLDMEKEYPAVVSLLKEIHKKGLLHSDPQIRNFIKNEDGLHVIDSNPVKPFWKSFDRAYEFVYLAKSAPGIEEYFGDMKNSIWYRLAQWYDRKDRQLALFRRRLKAAFKFS